ncbi:hypothetical protein GCM10009613_25460 [Pseudonocardia kongjuensis]|uniref:Transposase n=1 Tax=Pseudonocardia kongjuensis TaxID=102227 RepID=A0ABN1XRI5_9PSEU
MSCVSARSSLPGVRPQAGDPAAGRAAGACTTKRCNWIRQAEADHGERHDHPTTAEIEELRRLRKENTELRQANEILKGGEAWTQPVSATVPRIYQPGCRTRESYTAGC